MEELLLDILRALRSEPDLDGRQLKKIVDRRNAEAGTAERRYAKRQILPFYLRVKTEDAERWRSWDVSEAEEARLFELLRMKPGRTASGVATITVLTKPWPCSSDCLYCPNDLRMPKSYLHAEPACQRAERNFFDPYLQVASRLQTLVEMGHPCDKVELIVLGGTWTDYPRGYQVWFVEELFRALNDGATAFGDEASERRRVYRDLGIGDDGAELEDYTRTVQAELDAGRIGFAEGIRKLYGTSSPWEGVSAWQNTGLPDLRAQQVRNETARHRIVGLAIETRPDCISVDNLVAFRELGCTKVQIGVQSLRQEILEANERHLSVGQIRRAFELLRLFGFKVHAHFMANLFGSTPEGDAADYRRLVEDPGFMPDEVKLYPCALIDGTVLARRYRDGSWRPYDEGTLVGLLAEDLRATPPWTRVSRMIRDFSSDDILAGNKKPNLRQMVERRLRGEGADVREIRYREIRLGHVERSELRLEVIPYETTATSERFLQWATPQGEIAGFLRLSLPRREAVRGLGDASPVAEDEAMIREVHVYGSAERLGKTGSGAQHLGLGRELVERACDLAREAGYRRVNVISSVGTRAYYRKLGFFDNGLYQTREISGEGDGA